MVPVGFYNIKLTPALRRDLEAVRGWASYYPVPLTGRAPLQEPTSVPMPCPLCPPVLVSAIGTAPTEEGITPTPPGHP